MFERHDSARLGRIAKILVLVSAIALVTVWLAGPGSSTRGHLQKWFQSARVVDEQASADARGQGFLPRLGETPMRVAPRGTLARRRARGPAFLSPPMATR